MKPSEVIDTMLTEVIPDEDKWCKQSLHQIDGYGDKHCMLGALNMAVSGQPLTLTSCCLFEAGIVWNQTYFIIVNQIHQLPGCSIDSIITYNDVMTRTYDEVRAVLEKARAAAQEMGQ